MDKTERPTFLPHQLAGLEAAEGRAHVAYFWDMGLGKTYVGGEQAVRYGEPILCVCQKSKIRDWREHFERYYGDEWRVYDLTKKRELDTFLADEETRKVGVINYEVFWRRESILKLKGITALLDESALVSNEKAKRTKAVATMRRRGQIAHVVLLSGTPTSNGKYERLWTSAKLLGWDVTRNAWWQRFVITHELSLPGRPFPIKIVDGYRNTEELKQGLRDHGAQFLRTDECLDLPEQTDIDVRIPVTASYRKFLKNRVVEIDGEELVGDTPLTMRLRLRQLCGAYGSEKPEAVIDILNSTEESAVIFYAYTAEAALLRERIEKEGIRVYEVNGQRKEDAAFVADPDRAVLLAQYQAGAMGLNLQSKTRITIYYSPVDMSDLYDQSRKRTHRIGQSKPCLYYHILCEDSIDEDIVEAVKRGSDYTLELFRQKYDPEGVAE